MVGILREAERGEKTIGEISRTHGITEQTFYRWRQKYGGMDTSEVRRQRELEADNVRLKRLLAERDLEIDAMKEFLRKK